MKRIKNILPNLSAQLDRLYVLNEKLKESVLLTGFEPFDELTGGLRKGDLAVIHGSSSLDKTMISINIAHNVAKTEDKVVALFTQRISPIDTAAVLMSTISSVSLYRMKTGRLSDDDWEKYTVALNKLIRKKIFIHEKRKLRISDIHKKCTKLKNRYGRLDLIIVDGIDFLDKSESIQTEQAFNFDFLLENIRNIAFELDSPVILS